MYREVERSLFRVSYGTTGNSKFIEADTMQDLMRACAKMVVRGYHVAGVSRVLTSSKNTPRVSVLSTPEYKEILRKEQDRVRNHILESGDMVRTPRFCDVCLQEVFESEKQLGRAGYTEPTYYEDPVYTVRGKSIGFNQMVFAAAKKA